MSDSNDEGATTMTTTTAASCTPPRKALGSEDWEEKFQASAKERYEKEVRPFEGIIGHYQKLWHAYYKLVDKHEFLEREAKVLRAERKYSNDSSATMRSSAKRESSSSSSSEVVKLHEKLRAAQEELQSRYKNEAGAATETLRLTKEVQALKGKLDGAKTELARKDVQVSHLRKKAEESDTLRGELARVRSILEHSEAAVRDLSAQNQSLVERMVRDKSTMMQEMNKMTQMYEDMKRELADAKKKRGSGGFLSRIGRSKSKDEAKPKDEGSTSTFRAMSFGVPLPTHAMKTVQAHSNEINALAYDETGSLLAAGSSDGTVSLWISKTGRQHATLRSSSGGVSASPVMCVHVRRGMVLGSCSDRVARVWKIDTQRTMHTLTGHTGKIYAARLSPDCRIAITGGTDRKIMIFDMRNGYKIRVIGSPSICNSIDINEEGSVLASGHQSGEVCLWDLRSGKQILREKLHERGAVTSVSFSLGGTQLLTNSRDNTLKVLDSRTLNVLGTLGASKYRAAYNWSRAAYSPDSHYAVAGSADGALHFWDVPTPVADVSSCVKVLADSPAAAASVVWSPNGMQVASGHRDGKLTLWSP